MVQPQPIEEFFLESLLKISLASILIVISVDIYFTGFTQERSMIVNGMVLFAVLTAWVLYKLGHFRTSVIWTTTIITLAMFYQSITFNSITTSSMAVVMVIGFSYSVLLKNNLSLWLHGWTFSGIVLVFAWLASHPTQYGKKDASDIIVAGVTYAVLYFIIGYSSRMLKNRYDMMVESLASKNIEIATQNEELLQSQHNLFEINNHLESLVEKRTAEVKKQNEQLIKYAYANAHHVRGPVARLLGLIQLSKMETSLDYPFLFQKMEEQTVQIDDVIKNINRELEHQEGV